MKRYSGLKEKDYAWITKLRITGAMSMLVLCRAFGAHCFIR